MSRNGATPTKNRIRAAAHDYLDLVKRFPLRPLRTKTDFAAAGEILDELIGRDLTPGQRDYVAALTRFVEDFEAQRVRKNIERLSPVELLRHLMEENQMSTSDLGRVLGSRGLASEILHGKRGLSKASIGKLSSHFGVPPGLFLNPQAARLI